MDKEKERIISLISRKELMENLTVYTKDNVSWYKDKLNYDSPAVYADLNTAKKRGYNAPHKAVLLMAVIDLIDEGLITSKRIELTDELSKRFRYVWKRYLGKLTYFSPDVCQPFFHMQHEFFWRLADHEEARNNTPFDELAAKKLPEGRYALKALRGAFAYAEITDLLWKRLQSHEWRTYLRCELVSRHFKEQFRDSKAMWQL